MSIIGTHIRFCRLPVAVLSISSYCLRVHAIDNTGYGCLFYLKYITGTGNPCCGLWGAVLDITGYLKAVPGTGVSFYLIRVPGLDNLCYLISNTGHGLWVAYFVATRFEILKYFPFRISPFILSLLRFHLYAPIS